MPNPFAVAVKGKGLPNLVKRFFVLGRRYGLTPAKMSRLVGRFVRLLEEFGCRATFPLTAYTLTRGRAVPETYQRQGVEFAIHGYRHVDYSQLSLDQQLDHLNQARRMFEAYHVRCTGFRCPYLRWNQDTLTALSMLGFAYDSSQALAWDVVDGMDTDAYRRALNFYQARMAADYPALPQLIGNLVRIPYCLPDDEALVERLQLTGTRAMNEIWLKILRRTYERGELFTLGLHPERIVLCEEPLRAVLSQARLLSPAVWIAGLDEIATWWRSRAETTYQVVQERPDTLRLRVNGPPGTTLLARSVLVEASTEPWTNGYQLVSSTDFVFRADRLPFVGLSPDTPPALVHFLQQQGYLVRRGVDAQSCAFYLDRKHFAPEDERSLLTQVEEGTWPLVRLARWPNGALSALSITGDIDAITLWDYVSRVSGD